MNATTVNEGSATEQTQSSTIFVANAGSELVTGVYFDLETALLSQDAEGIIEVSTVGEIAPGYRAQRSDDPNFDLYAFMQMIELAEMAAVLRDGSRFIGAELDLALDLSNQRPARISIFGGEEEFADRLNELLPHSDAGVVFSGGKDLTRSDFEILTDLLDEARALVLYRASEPIYLIDRSKDGLAPILSADQALADGLALVFPSREARYAGELPEDWERSFVSSSTTASAALQLLALAEALGAPLSLLLDFRDDYRPVLDLVEGFEDFVEALEDWLGDTTSDSISGWDRQAVMELLATIGEIVGKPSFDYGQSIAIHSSWKVSTYRSGGLL